MARKHCGKFRTRTGEVVTPPRRGEHGDESMSEHIKRYEVWCRTWHEIGIDNTRCACDPEHPHRPKDES